MGSCNLVSLVEFAFSKVGTKLTMVAFTGMAGPQQQFGQNMHQQASSTFGSIASMGPPAPPQQQQQQPPQGDKFAPGNIFAAMKRQDFGKPDEQRPQDSGELVVPTACGGCEGQS